MFIKVLNIIEESLIKMLLVAMVLVVFYDVIDRFFIKNGNIWSQELISVISAWFILIGASYGIKHGVHIGVDAVIKRLSPQKARFASLFIITATLIYTLIFLYGSYDYISKIYKIGIYMDDLPLPKWLPMLSLIVGYLSLLARILILGKDILLEKEVGFRFSQH